MDDRGRDFRISSCVGGFPILGLLLRPCNLAPGVRQQLSDFQAEGNVPYLLVMAQDAIPLAGQFYGVFQGLIPESLALSLYSALLQVSQASSSLSNLFLVKQAGMVCFCNGTLANTTVIVHAQYMQI